MIRPTIALSLPFAILLGCATTDAPRNTMSLGPAVSIGALPEPVTRVQEQDSGNDLARLPGVPLHRYRQTVSQLEFWESETFERYFMNTYIPETDIEPPVNVEEAEVLQKVQRYFQSDRMDRALDLLHAKNAADATAVFDFMIGNIHLQQDEIELAIAAYSSATEKYGKFRRAWQNMGVCHVQKGDFLAARPALTKVLELGARDAITYGMLGLAHSADDEHVAAETAFRMAVLLDPATLDWKMNLARSMFKQQRYDDVAAMLAELISDNPARGDLWLLQANAYIGMNQPLRAMENYVMVDQLGASTTGSLLTLADICVNEKLFGMAVQRYIEALEMEPESGLDRIVRACKVLAAQGAVGETATLIDYVENQYGTELDTEERTALLKLRARLAVASGAGGAAEAEILEQVVALNPTDGEALLLLGQFYRGIGDFDRAMLRLQQAESIPEFEADAKVRQAQVMVDQGRVKDAVRLLRQAQAVKPRDNVQDFLDQVERSARNQ